MKRVVLIAALLTASLASAGEVLVLTTATKMTSTMTGRKATEVQNLGPNPIFCQLITGTGLAVNKGRRVDSNGGSWAFDGARDLYCITSVNQATTAATIVTEPN